MIFDTDKQVNHPMAGLLTKCRERLFTVLLIKGIEINVILPSLLSSLHIKTKIMMISWEKGKTCPCLCLELYFILGFTAGTFLWRLREKHGIVLGACGSLMDVNPTLTKKYVYIVLSPISKTIPTQQPHFQLSLLEQAATWYTVFLSVIYYLSQDCWHIRNFLAVPS